MELNFEKDRLIDRDNLAEEWLNQSNLVGNYGKQLVKAKRRRDNLWESLKVVRSELIKECKEKNKKATAAEVEAYYRTNIRHKKAKRRLIKAEYEIGLIEVAYDTLRFQKKEAMKELRRMQDDEMFAEDDMDFTRRAKKQEARKQQKRRLKRNRGD